MKTLNKTIAEGYLGDNPRFSENEYGKVSYASIALNKSFLRKGEKIENTVWLDIKAKGDLAQLMADTLKKGDRITVCGSLIPMIRLIDKKEVSYPGLLLDELIKR